MKRKRIVSIYFLSFLLVSSSFALSQSKLKVLYGSYLKGLAYFDNGRYRDSLKEFEKAKGIDANSSYIRIKEAFVLMRLGELDKAEKEFKKAKSLDPDRLESSLGLIFIYSYKGEKDKLEAEYEYFLQKAHKLRPEDARISEYLGQFYFYKKRLDDAIKVYGAIVKEHPDYIEGKYLLGYFYEEKGLHNKAIQIWKDVLRQNSSHAETLNALSYLYAEEGRNLNKAEYMIKRALKQDSNNGAYLDTLGWIYFKKRDYKDSEKYLKKAIESVKDPVIYEHLGDLYIKLNDIKKALDNYNKGFKLNPKNESIRRKLDRYGRKDKNFEEKGKPDKKANN